MEKIHTNIRNIYALFEMCSPEFIAAYQPHIPNSEIVAAKLIANAHRNSASICINSVDNKQHNFMLDLNSRTYQSKGNWIWVQQIEIYFPDKKLFSLSLTPRVIDVPYTNDKVCAYWMFRNVTQELKLLIESYL